MPSTKGGFNASIVMTMSVSHPRPLVGRLVAATIPLVIAVLVVGLIIGRAASGGLLSTLSTSELTAAGLALAPPGQAELSGVHVTRARAVSSARADVDAAYADDAVLARYSNAKSGQSCLCWVVDVTSNERTVGQGFLGVVSSPQAFVVVAVDARTGIAIDAMAYSPPA